jgi:hypothetical protein
VSYWSRDFEGLPVQLTEVRKFTRFVAGDRDVADLMEMVASELAGNTIQHSDSGEPADKFTLQVPDFQDLWHIRMFNQGGPTVPHIRELTSTGITESLGTLGDEAGLAKDLGQSESYGALLRLAAAMDSESQTLVPTSAGERLTWESHLFGLFAALHCVVTQKQYYAPDSSAEIIDIHLRQARAILRRPTSESGA